MSDKSLQSELTARLQASEDELDSEALAQLRRARQRALASQSAADARPDRFAPWQGWLLAASVAVVAVLVSLPGRTPIPAEPGAVMAVEEGPHEDLEFYENLEFYEWLAAQEDLG